MNPELSNTSQLVYFESFLTKVCIIKHTNSELNQHVTYRFLHLVTSSTGPFFLSRWTCQVPCTVWRFSWI